MWVIFIKSLFNLLHYCFYFMFWFSGPKACGIIAPQPEMEPPPPALEGEGLTTGLPGKAYPSPLLHSLIYLFQKRRQASSSKALAAHCTWLEFNNRTLWSFPGGSDGKESACDAGEPYSTPGSGRSPGQGNGNPIRDFCLKNPMDRGAWRATVHRVANSQT